jgi:ACT domain-containing protein
MSRNIVADKKALLDYLQKTPIVEVACKQTGVGRSTYYRWRKDDEEFAEAADNAIEQSTGVINDMAESQLIKAIKNNNMTGYYVLAQKQTPTVPNEGRSARYAGPHDGSAHGGADATDTKVTALCRANLQRGKP